MRCAVVSSSWKTEKSYATRNEGCTAMARKFDYFFRETATGIKRNGLATFAAISTAFIALLLLGLALLVRREVDLIVAATGGKVEVSVYLSDDISETQQQALLQKIQAMPQVSGVEYVSK